MCGIVGYLGHRQAVPVLLQGLERLEYRGYDSAGIAVIDSSGLKITKSAGRLTELKARLNGHLDGATLGIGHTRWATHGRPTDTNAHPHPDCSGRFAVVHNGIIENYQELRQWLKAEGHTFLSETDTEVLAHLVEHYYRGDLLQAVMAMLPHVKGSYAVAVIGKDHPREIVGVRYDSPLIVGLGREETFLASDIPALLPYTKNTYILDNGEVAYLSPEGPRILDGTGHLKQKQVFHVSWDLEAAEKGGYPHFMLKEIHEQPRALRDTLAGRLDPASGRVKLDGVRLTPEEAKAIRKVALIACGTASYAGMVAKYVWEKLLRLPVEFDVASELRYRQPLMDEGTLGLVISQSGETADTLAGLREARRLGARILAVTNVVGSSVAREADDVLYTWAGPEIAVASTKAYLTQVAAVYLLALYLGTARGEAPWAAELARELSVTPSKVEEVLALEDRFRELAARIAPHEHAFFLGRGLDYAVALEGALKLKEISYLHAEACPAGELKHGPLALIEDGTPVVALVTQEELVEKMLSNIREVKARGAWVLALALEGNRAVAAEADCVLYLPRLHNLLTPLVSVVPLQLLAYYTAAARGCSVDKPRNLAKSVTVE
ncbi:glutamine--fructose-6-phosphate transaminase (isomerizing) [Thermanaeromonas sp. C210]|uniref:glutamine--fructose-6-phosphate transaminase (isomerizing) n=1 Tax=Thermanaeromonas sp. C210 TaxID=2731925 RepID=UPI00155B746B|nr:glutamine--fructose-6-phosphate transaminase (isomerizing) [Thermanaeromonas sp. C210]GFN21999.1 glutamine--fructose-6-phosphate aminotransferase [isomerizing] [Thermanaeromonas sp. C210]